MQKVSSFTGDEHMLSGARDQLRIFQKLKPLLERKTVVDLGIVAGGFEVRFTQVRHRDTMPSRFRNELQHGNLCFPNQSMVRIKGQRD